MTARAIRRLLLLLLVVGWLSVACGDGGSPQLEPVSTSPTDPADPAATANSREAASVASSQPTRLVDRFNQTGDLATMALTGDGLDWVVHAGRWAVADRQLLLAKRPAWERGLATVETGSGDGLVRVRMEQVAGQTGLAFRFIDMRNYWAVVAAPYFGTWVVFHVVDGDHVQVGDLGLVTTEPGTTVAVRLDGDRISLLINGEVVKTFTDATHIGATSMGVIGYGSEVTAARWDLFVVESTPR